jgi:hypothetical protein
MNAHIVDNAENGLAHSAIRRRQGYGGQVRDPHSAIGVELC